MVRAGFIKQRHGFWVCNSCLGEMKHGMVGTKVWGARLALGLVVHVLRKRKRILGAISGRGTDEETEVNKERRAQQNAW